MTLATLRFGYYKQCPGRDGRGCLTTISVERESCYFCARRGPVAVPPTPLEHVRSHLREQDRPLLDPLTQALTLTEVAAELGAGWTERMVEQAWLHIRADMALSDGRPGMQSVERMALLRIVAGLDPCWCGNY